MIVTSSPPQTNKPTGGMYLQSQQDNLVSGVATIVELNRVCDSCYDGIEDTDLYRIVPGVPGWYLVFGQVTFVNVVADKKYEAHIHWSGWNGIDYAYKHAALADHLTVQVCLLLKLCLASDYLQLKARSFAGVDTVSIVEGEEYTFLKVTRIR